MAAEVSGLDHMIVVALSKSHAPFRLHVDVGSRFPALISATGRLTAAFSQSSWDKIEKRFRSLKWASAPDYELWKSEVEQARARGYSIDFGNYISGITLVGVPVFDAKHRMTHSLTAAGVANQIDKDLAKSIAMEMLRDAEELSKLSPLPK